MTKESRPCSALLHDVDDDDDVEVSACVTAAPGPFCFRRRIFLSSFFFLLFSEAVGVAAGGIFPVKSVRENNKKKPPTNWRPHETSVCREMPDGGKNSVQERPVKLGNRPFGVVD